MKHSKTIPARLAAVFFAAAFLIAAAPIVSADEAEESLLLPSGKRLSVLENVLETTKQDYENYADYASAAVGIIQGDEIVYEDYFGETNKELHMAADEDSVYEWGSVSKTLIWVSAMQLWEQGKLDLEKDVREYLPEGFFQHLSYDDPITMLNLMNHSGGWQEMSHPIWETDESSIPTLAEALQASEPAQIHRPGEVTAYSNYGAAVAAYVVECVSGTDYCEYVHQHIFEPLGMEHTALNAIHSDNSYVYEQRKKMHSYKFQLDQCQDRGSCLYYVAVYPAGAATGTLRDLMTYMQALVSEEAPLFEKPETQEIMFTGTSFYGDSDVPMLAHGFACAETSVTLFGHDGATVFGQALMMFDRTSKTGVAVMVNEQKGNWFLSNVMTMVFGQMPADRFGEASGTETLKGYYLPSRAVYRGIGKYTAYLSAEYVDDEAESLGSGLFQSRYREGDLFGNEEEEYASLFGIKTASDGTQHIQMGAGELIRDPLYLVKLLLLTLHVILGIAAVYMLRIRFHARKQGGAALFAGTGYIAAGEIARILSVAVMVILYANSSGNHGGSSLFVCTTIGVIQMICIAVCGIAAVISVITALKRKAEKGFSVRCMISAAGNALAVFAIVFFEMYRFWGI